MGAIWALSQPVAKSSYLGFMPHHRTEYSFRFARREGHRCRHPHALEQRVILPTPLQVLLYDEGYEMQNPTLSSVVRAAAETSCSSDWQSDTVPWLFQETTADKNKPCATSCSFQRYLVR